MVDFKKAIKRPFQNFKKLTIGALLGLIPFVNLITGLFVAGYTLNCAKKPEEKLPEWENWTELFIKGITAAVVGFLYALPFIIIGFIAIITTGQGITHGRPGNMIAGGFMIILILVLMAILGYIMPMVLMHYVQEFEFKDAFQISNILDKVLTGEYFITWLFVMVYGFLGSIVLGIASSITSFTIVAPLILSAYFSMIMGVTSMTAYGEVYQEI